MHRVPLRRRRFVTLSLLSLTVRGTVAAPLADEARAAMLAFDSLYIPALFLTGSAGKTAEGPAKASAAMQRLIDAWPAQRRALAAAVAVADRLRWGRALDAVQGKLHEGQALVAGARWEPSHEVLEQVREILFEARRALGLDYVLDHFTAFHTAMEKVANTTRVQRPAIETDFAAARALWSRIEALSFDPALYGLTPARANQLAQARADETLALGRLSQALRTADDADVLKAAAAIKAPFVRAYLAFGATP